MLVQKQKDAQKNISVSQENRCYLCNRTETEVQEFLIPELDEITKKLDSEIANLESILQDKKNSLKSHLDEILKTTEKTNLDFKIDAVLEDIDSFKKIIPKVEDLIKIYSKIQHYEGGGLSYNPYYLNSEFKYLSDMRKNLLELRKGIGDDQIYEKIRKKNLELGKVGDWYSDGGYYRIISKNDDDYYNRKTNFEIGNEEIEKILENLEKTHKERDMHQKSLEHKKAFIKETKHLKFSREIVSPNYIHMRARDHSEVRKQLREMEERPELYKTPIKVPICVICNTFVWHESPAPF